MARVKSIIIPRQKLMEVFDNLVDKRFVYVCAPAGYGKTVAVRQWLDGCEHKSAFISLDEYDDNPANLCVRFCTALRLCQSKNPALSEIISHPSFNTAADEFTFRAISVLGTPEKAVLIIDDLHHLQDEKNLRLLLSFIKKLPDAFQVIMLSRHKLPSGFIDLWMKDHIACVTTEQLRFSTEEIKDLYQNRGQRITTLHAEEILRFTGGWAIGIGAMLLSGGNDEEVLTGRLEYLDKFIEDNIWHRWSEQTQDFLINTSVVHDMSPELCDALITGNNSKSILDSLMLENAFISRQQNCVYRYHDLFHKFLNYKLAERGSEYSNELLIKAGWWYLSNNDFYKAVDCFLRAENQDGLIHCFGLLVTSGHEYFFVDKLIQIANSSLIHATAKLYPNIYSILSWAAFNEGNAEYMAYYADKYYENQNKIVLLDPRVILNIMFVRLIDFRKTLFELVHGSSDDLVPEIENISDMGVSVGIINQNMPFLHKGTRDFSECAKGDVEKNMSLMRKTFGKLFGEQAQLLEESIVAGLLYEQGFLEKAHTHAATAIAKIKKHFIPEVEFCAMAVLARVLDALKQYDKADQVIDSMSDMIEGNKAYPLLSNFNAIKIRRKLQMGDIKAAKDWIFEYRPSLNGQLDFYKLYLHITTCRAYIANEDYDYAIVLSKKVLELSEKYKRPLDVIEAHTLLAIAYWKKKRGFQDEALRHLESAVTEAHNFGYIQLFVNEGAEVSGILKRLQNRISQPAYSSLVPVSFVKYLCIKTMEGPDTGLTSGQSVKSVKFTPKQKNVAKLLYEGKSYNEISVILGISKATVRSHISHIYSKLNVTNQADAAKLINKLGVFADTQ